MTLPGKTAVLTVLVKPGASRRGILGMRGDALRVAVSAPPEKGKANKAVAKLLAKRFGVPPSSVTVIVGAASRRKTLRFDGISQEQLNRFLSDVGKE